MYLESDRYENAMQQYATIVSELATQYLICRYVLISVYCTLEL